MSTHETGSVSLAPVVVPSHAEAVRRALNDGTAQSQGLGASKELMAALRRSAVAKRRWVAMRIKGTAHTARRKASCIKAARIRWERVRAQKGLTT